MFAKKIKYTTLFSVDRVGLLFSSHNSFTIRYDFILLKWDIMGFFTYYCSMANTVHYTFYNCVTYMPCLSR